MKDSQHQPHFRWLWLKTWLSVDFHHQTRLDAGWFIGSWTAGPQHRAMAGGGASHDPIPVTIKVFQIIYEIIQIYTHIKIYMMDHDGSWIMIPFNPMGTVWCLNLKHIIECPNIETHQSLLTQIHKTLALLPANLRERSLPGFEEEGRSVLGWNGEGSGRLENVVISYHCFKGVEGW